MHVGVIHRISDPEGSNAPNRRPLRRASLTALVFPSMPPLPTTGPASASGKDLRSMQLRELVESVVGPFSQNEYLALEVDGLPTSEA